jgi:hypothetical protein
MKTKYEPASKHYTIRCNETHEEQDFETESECIEWAKKVAHTFGSQMTFTLTRVTEESSEIWADTNAEAGMVR